MLPLVRQRFSEAQQCTLVYHLLCDFPHPLGNTVAPRTYSVGCQISCWFWVVRHCRQV
jgi:hypothetical protein